MGFIEHSDTQRLPRDPFTELVGLVWDEVSPERVRAHLDITPDHHQAMGIVHGGVYTTVIEVAASVGATLNLASDNTVAVGISNNTDFIRSHRTGRLEIVARPVHTTEPHQFWDVVVSRADDAKLVAKGQVRLAVVPFEHLGP